MGSICVCCWVRAMSDLQNRFRRLDDQPTPDLWHEIEARAQEAELRRPRTTPWSLIAVTLLLLALAIGGAALIGSGIVKLPVLLPAPTIAATPEPASGRIVFGRYDRFVGDFVVYLIDPNGTTESQLLPGGYECPRWSPDGQEFARIGRLRGRWSRRRRSDRSPVSRAACGICQIPR